MRLEPSEITRRRVRLTEVARSLIGRPYFYGAKSDEAPERFDCSSFVQYCYAQVGVALPRVSIDQARCGRRVRSIIAALRVGDLIFLRGKVGRYDRRFPQGIGHVILVTGADEVTHAKFRREGGRDGGRVVRQRLTTILRRQDITVIKRIL